MYESKWIRNAKRRLELPGSVSPFETWCHDIKSRPSDDRDAQILVSGDVRKGKSTFAYKVARHLDPTFDHERMVFDISTFREIADELPNGDELPPGEVRCLVWDEMVEGGMSREAMTKQNREMQKFFVVCGERNLIGFQLAPHIDVFDSYLRHYRATDWIMIPNRGHAKGHVRSTGGDYAGKKKHWEDVWLKRFTKEDGPDFHAYKARKQDMVRNIGDSPGRSESGTARDFPSLNSAIGL